MPATLSLAARLLNLPAAQFFLLGRVFIPPPDPPLPWDLGWVVQMGMYWALQVICVFVYFWAALMLALSQVVIYVRNLLLDFSGVLVGNLVESLYPLYYVGIVAAVLGIAVFLMARWLMTFEVSRLDRLVIVTIVIVVMSWNAPEVIRSFDLIRQSVAQMVYTLAFSGIQDSWENQGNTLPAVPPGVCTLSVVENNAGCSGYEVTMWYLYITNEDDLNTLLPTTQFKEQFYCLAPANGCAQVSWADFPLMGSADREAVVDSAQAAIYRVIKSWVLSTRSALEQMLWLVLTIATINLFVALAIALIFAAFIPAGDLLGQITQQFIQLFMLSAWAGVLMGMMMGLSLVYMNNDLYLIGLNALTLILFVGLMGRAMKAMSESFGVIANGIVSQGIGLPMQMAGTTAAVGAGFAGGLAGMALGGPAGAAIGSSVGGMAGGAIKGVTDSGASFFGVGGNRGYGPGAAIEDVGELQTLPGDSFVAPGSAAASMLAAAPTAAASASAPSPRLSVTAPRLAGAAANSVSGGAPAASATAVASAPAGRASGVTALSSTSRQTAAPGTGLGQPATTASAAPTFGGETPVGGATAISVAPAAPVPFGPADKDQIIRELDALHRELKAMEDKQQAMMDAAAAREQKREDAQAAQERVRIAESKKRDEEAHDRMTRMMLTQAIGLISPPAAQIASSFSAGQDLAGYLKKLGEPTNRTTLDRGLSAHLAGDTTTALAAGAQIEMMTRQHQAAQQMAEQQRLQQMAAPTAPATPTPVTPTWTDAASAAFAATGDPAQAWQQNRNAPQLDPQAAQALNALVYTGRAAYLGEDGKEFAEIVRQAAQGNTADAEHALMQPRHGATMNPAQAQTFIQNAQRLAPVIMAAPAQTDGGQTSVNVTPQPAAPAPVVGPVPTAAPTYARADGGPIPATATGYTPAPSRMSPPAQMGPGSGPVAAPPADVMSSPVIESPAISATPDLPPGGGGLTINPYAQTRERDGEQVLPEAWRRQMAASGQPVPPGAQPPNTPPPLAVPPSDPTPLEVNQQ